MENYDLKGIIVEGKKAVIAVSLPEPTRGNAYFVHETHNVAENKILIHFKDFTGDDFTGDSANLESFIIDLTAPKFSNFDFSKEIEVALCHENKDSLNGTPAEVFARAYNKPFPIVKNILEPDATGKGIIRP